MIVQKCIRNITKTQDKLPQVEEILTTVSTLCDKGIEGIQYAKDNLPKVENILNDITAKIGSLKDSDDLKDLLELIQNNVEEELIILLHQWN